jgi:hypothetical protein
LTMGIGEADTEIDDDSEIDGIVDCDADGADGEVDTDCKGVGQV